MMILSHYQPEFGARVNLRIRSHTKAIWFYCEKDAPYSGYPSMVFIGFQPFGINGVSGLQVNTQNPQKNGYLFLCILALWNTGSLRISQKKRNR